jgi:hypothetical protein
MSQFDSRKVDAVDVCFFGQTLLRPALLSSQLPNVRWARDFAAGGGGRGTRRFATPVMLVRAAELLNKP